MVEAYQSLSLPGADLPWLRELRQAAAENFARDGFPSPRQEEWKYTNVSALGKKPFAPQASASGLESAWLASQKLAGTWTLVLVDGHMDAENSDLAGLPEAVIVSGIAEALREHSSLVGELFGSTLERDSHGFLDFNTGYFSDGVLLHVPAGLVLERPLHLLQVSTQTGVLSNIRSLISLEQHAEAKFIESFVGMAGQGYLTAAVTEICLGENAGLEHFKVQAESAQAYHFGGVYARQAKTSRFRQHNLSFGGLLARHEIHSELASGAECELNGLFLGKDRQHVDSHTLVHHTEPHGSSRETYRGVLADRARGVFQGRIVVHPQAQKTSAEMNNRNLLLSEEAEIDAKPQLEILADDVKCSHGVAVGQLDQESVFYLLSRGLDQETARNMLSFAFANEMVEKISFPELKARVQDHLLELFPQTGIRRDWL